MSERAGGPKCGWGSTWLHTLSLSFSLSFLFLFLSLSLFLFLFLFLFLSTYISICLFVCLSVCLSVSPSVRPLSVRSLSVCLSSVYLSICLSVYRLSVCLTIYLTIYLSSYLSFWLRIYPWFITMWLIIWLSIHLSVYPSIYLTTYHSVLSILFYPILLCSVLSWLVFFLFLLLLSFLFLFLFLFYPVFDIPQHQKRSNFLRLSWRSRVNMHQCLFLRFFHQYCACGEKAGPGHTKCCTCHKMSRNHLREPEDLMLQNATLLRKSAPWPPNMPDSHVSCLCLPLEINLLQIHFQRPTLAIAFCNCHKTFKLFLTLGKVQNPLRLPRKIQKWPEHVLFLHFDFDMRFAPQRRAPFRHPNLAKWSETASF